MIGGGVAVGATFAVGFVADEDALVVLLPQEVMNSTAMISTIADNTFLVFILLFFLIFSHLTKFVLTIL